MKTSLGDIIFLNRRGKSASWYSPFVRFFTKKPYTHVAIIIDDIYGVPTVLSAEGLVKVHPLEQYLTEETTDIEIYMINNIDAEALEYFRKEVYLKYINKDYGSYQVLWFIYRWFMELFSLDVRKQRNPLSKGIICSELTYNYLLEVFKSNDKISLKLKEFNSNTINVGDVNDICKQFKDEFTLIYKK